MARAVFSSRHGILTRVQRFFLVLLLALFSMRSEAQWQQQPAAGMLLIADVTMSDPRFRESVILLLEYSSQKGALGLVLNRPTALSLGDALPDYDTYPGTDDPLFWGGPVGLERLLLLVRGATPPEAADQVIAGVYWSASRSVLLEHLQNGQDSAGIRVYIGHSGWSPGQLEGELAQHAWHLRAATPDDIFSTDLDQLWQQLQQPHSDGILVDIDRDHSRA